LSRNNAQTRYGIAVSVLLAIMLVMSMIVPRAIAFAAPGVGVLAYLAARPVLGHWLVPPRPALIWCAITLALMGLSTLWAVEPDFALERTLKTAGIFLGGVLFMAVIRTAPPAMLRSFPALFIGGFIIGAALMIFELYSGGILYQAIRPEERLEEESFNLSNLNRSVVILTISFFPALALIRQIGAKRLQFALFAAVLGLMTMVILKTNSQSAQLALAIGTLIFLVFPVRRKAVWAGVGLILCAGTLATPFLAQILFDYLPPLIEDHYWFQQSYAANRMEIWDFISRRALEQPFLGYGVEATRHMTFDSRQIYHPSPEILHPHNLFVQIWIEFGLLGAVLLCGFLGDILSRIARLAPEPARIFLPTFLAILSVGTTGYGLWQGWWLGTFMWAAAVLMLLREFYDARGFSPKAAAMD